MTNFKFDDYGHALKWIAVKKISVIWVEAQQPLDRRRVERIKAGFNPDLFDLVVVCEVTTAAGDVAYHCIDGQHRIQAILDMYGEDEQVPCRVVKAASPARAAEIFDGINTGRRPPNALSKFKVRVTAGREPECTINSIVTGLGYRIVAHDGDDTIRCVAALITVCNRYGPEVLKEALVSIATTWKRDAAGFAGPLVSGYGAFIAKHRDGLDWVHFRTQVAKHHTPTLLLTRGKARAGNRGVSVVQGIEAELEETYDKGRRSGKVSGSRPRPGSRTAFRDAAE